MHADLGGDKPVMPAVSSNPNSIGVDLRHLVGVENRAASTPVILEEDRR